MAFQNKDSHIEISGKNSKNHAKVPKGKVDFKNPPP